MQTRRASRRCSRAHRWENTAIPTTSAGLCQWTPRSAELDHLPDLFEAGIPARTRRRNPAVPASAKRASRVEENAAADAVELAGEQLAKLSSMPPAAGETRTEAQAQMLER